MRTTHSPVRLGAVLLSSLSFLALFAVYLSFHIKYSFGAHEYREFGEEQARRWIRSHRELMRVPSVASTIQELRHFAQRQGRGPLRQHEERLCVGITSSPSRPVPYLHKTLVSLVANTSIGRLCY